MFCQHAARQEPYTRAHRGCQAVDARWQSQYREFLYQKGALVLRMLTDAEWLSVIPPAKAAEKWACRQLQQEACLVTSAVPCCGHEQLCIQQLAAWAALLHSLMCTQCSSSSSQVAARLECSKLLRTTDTDAIQTTCS